MAKPNLKEIKREIEDRYTRLAQGQRRPSLEYISPQEIRQIFLKYARDPEQFLKLSDEDMLRLYQEWYAQLSNQPESIPEEDPDIDDSAK